jgi:hypothetical protein
MRQGSAREDIDEASFMFVGFVIHGFAGRARFTWCAIREVLSLSSLHSRVKKDLSHNESGSKGTHESTPSI